MCLAVPGRILSISGDIAQVDVQGVVIEANITLVEGLVADDWIMIHTGFAIQKYNEQEALENLELLKEVQKRADELQ